MKLFDTLKALSRPAACVVQVGAHEGQEIELFRRHGVRRAILIEPMDDAFAKLGEAIGDDTRFTPVQALCSSLDGEKVSFFRASNTQASSMLAPERVLVEHPKIKFEAPVVMTARTLDSLVEELALKLDDFAVEDIDILYMDTQGAELKVLMGAGRVLHHAKAVWTEVSYDLYRGGATLEDMQGFLKPFGFQLNAVSLNAHAWGNALFLKR